MKTIQAQLVLDGQTELFTVIEDDEGIGMLLDWLDHWNRAIIPNFLPSTVYQLKINRYGM